MENFQIVNSILVNLDFTIWTGRAKLDVTDIPEASSAMPPKELYTAGSIKIFDTDNLKVFRNFKTHADLCVASVGCRLLSGWLVDEANLDALEKELEACYNDWMAALREFDHFYPARADDWAKRCGQWESLVKQKQPDPCDISDRFHFGWQTFRLTPETSGTAGAGNETDYMVKDIPDKALMSVIDSLKTLWTDSFDKQADPSAKAYNALRKVAERAQALGFANPLAARLAPVLFDLVDRRNHMLSRLVLSRMSVPQDVEDILSVNDGQGLDSLLPAVQPEPEPDDLLAEAQQLLNSAPVNSMDVLDSLGLF